MSYPDNRIMPKTETAEADKQGNKKIAYSKNYKCEFLSKKIAIN